MLAQRAGPPLRQCRRIGRRPGAVSRGRAGPGPAHRRLGAGCQVGSAKTGRGCACGCLFFDRRRARDRRAHPCVATSRRPGAVGGERRGGTPAAHPPARGAGNATAGYGRRPRRPALVRGGAAPVGGPTWRRRRPPHSHGSHFAALPPPGSSVEPRHAAATYCVQRGRTSHPHGGGRRDGAGLGHGNRGNHGARVGARQPDLGRCRQP